MQFWATVLLASALAQQQAAEPVTKIIETLQNVFGNIQEEHQSDEITYKHYYGWCNDAFAQRKSEHTRSLAAKQELSSKLQVQQALNKQLKDETGQLEDELKDTKTTISQASEMRQQEHEDYLKEEQNIGQVLQSLNRAVDVLTSSTSKSTLLQVTNSLQQLASQSSVVSDQQRDQLQMFAQRAHNTMDDEDVISQSSGVTQVLHQLISNFQSSAASAVGQEKDALERYDSLISLKKQAFQQGVGAKDSKDALLAESLQRTAQVQRSVEDATTSVTSREEYLHDLQNVCAHKSSQWAARSQSRADVLEGLQRSLAALTGDTAAIKQLQPQQQQQQPQQMQQQQQPQQMQQQQQPQQMQQQQQQQQQQPQQMQQQPMQQQQQQQFMQTMPQQSMQMQPMQQPFSFVQFGMENQMGMQQMGMMNMAMPQQQQSQQQMGMLAVQQAAQEAPAANTYRAVTGMIESMSGQIQSSTSDEDKHKEWCDREITTNSGAQSEKSAKLQRLATKIDNQREMVSSLDADLKGETDESTSLQETLKMLAKLRMEERDLHTKSTQNHQMATQILAQATTILQRVNALAAQSQAPSTFGFLQAGGESQMNAVSGAAVESLSSLQSRYATLMSSCDKAETQAGLDLEAFGRASQTLQESLARSHNYKTSVRLEGMSGLDQDTEDEASIKASLQSTTEYLNRLRSSCAGILQHYDERRQRREQSLQVLNQAKNVISVDNAEEIHSQLSTLAANTDNLAAKLVSTSTQMAPQPAAAPQVQSLSLLANSNSLSAMAQQFSANAPLMETARPHSPAPQAPQQVQQVQQFQQPQTQMMQMPQEGTSVQAASILHDLEGLQEMSNPGPMSAGQAVDNNLGMIAAQ